MTITCTDNQVDELIMTLENEHGFYIDFTRLCESVAPSFFELRRGNKSMEIAYTWALNGLSFSKKEALASRVADIVRKHTRKASVENNYFGSDAMRGAAEHFVNGVESSIRSGEVGISGELNSTLTTLYILNDGNVSKTARELGTTAYQVGKSKDLMSRDAFMRFHKVQGGEAYSMVMGDCEGFINNMPRFTPVQYLEQGDKDVCKGDLVAESGSSRFYEVSELGASGGIVYTVDGCPLIHFPLRLLPKQYIESAARFCGSVNRLPTNEYLASKV